MFKVATELIPPLVLRFASTARPGQIPWGKSFDQTHPIGAKNRRDDADGVLSCKKSELSGSQNWSTKLRRIWRARTVKCWLGVRDDLRNWLQLGLPARERA